MKASTLRSLRRYHHYIGVFLAPAILFFAFSGIIQVIGLQDQRDPPAPAWISYIAGIHKHQTAPKPRKPAPAGTARPGAPREEHKNPFVPLKIFALLTAIGLFLTTLIGLVIALTNRASRRASWVMLVLGIVVPAILMAL